MLGTPGDYFIIFNVIPDINSIYLDPIIAINIGIIKKEIPRTDIYTLDLI